jgi:alkanesulfonate monooxygenase SsuD/methylene tetrahydromethanopterin reductase-like flavin-dependent oxidoreductase (luciferase family)
LSQGEQRAPSVVSATRNKFDPTKPPQRRLVRLGVVFDGRTPHSAVMPLSRMCERAGIDVVWVADSLDGTALLGEIDAWAVAAGLLDALRTATVGAMVAEAGPFVALADVAPRLELCLLDGGADGAVARSFRDAVSHSARAPRLSVVARSSRELGPLLEIADDLVLSAWDHPDLETAADETRAAAVDAGRDAASLGVAALVPVSVGRTDAEASARAQMDPEFARFGHPADIGIFGTLEECQDRVIALAHAGITDLRCVLPATPDVHDVIAQLTAMTIGSVDVLVPGSLRSPSPPPPEGWGGRPDRPLAPRISAGSRRRR